MAPSVHRASVSGVVLATAAIVASLGGCATALVVRQSQEPSKLEWSKTGAPRSLVERELGKPVRTEYNVSTYVYLDIVYGPGDKVIGLTHSGSRRVFRDWMEDNEREAKLAKLDYAANTGFAAAQMVQATRYRYGVWKTETDPVRAYVWARLAEMGGHPGAREALNAWAKTMPPAQVTEAERRFNAWEPEIPVEIRLNEPVVAPLPLPPLEPMALADALAEAASKGEWVAGPLGVLVIGMSNGKILRPAFIDVDNIESAAGAIARLVQKNFAVAVPAGSPEKTRPRSLITWVCMIARDGNKVELDFTSDSARQRLDRERVSPEFRSEVMAVMRNSAAYKGGYVCGLHVATHWPTDLRSRIFAFVEGIAAP